jgi:hypothetical protein
MDTRLIFRDPAWRLSRGRRHCERGRGARNPRAARPTAFDLEASRSVASQAFAHYRFTQLITGGTTNPTFKYIREWTPNYSNSPVTDVNSQNIVCNGPGTSPKSEVAEVTAGSTVGFVSDQAVSHPGPYSAYLAKAPGDVTQWNAQGGAWFKIWQQGPTGASSSGLTWNNGSKFTFNLPRAIPNGDYLLRFEHIGLHGASGVGGAQFYISCAQLRVTGGSGGSPGPTISLPGGLKATDPGIQINIYYPVPTNYQIPGPAVYSG